MRHLRSTLALAGVVACATPLATAAQKLEMTPFFASHYSISNYFDEDLFTGTVTERVTEKTGSGPAIGVRLTYWLSQTLGIEAEGLYSKANQQNAFPDRDASTGQLTGTLYKANVTMASGRLLFRPRRSNLRLFAGISHLTFGGDVYTYAPYSYTNLSTIGGVVGFGVRAQATRSLALDVSVEAYLHNLDRGDGPYLPVELKGAFQQEVLIAVGVPIKLMN